jgi:hypothetical protein
LGTCFSSLGWGWGRDYNFPFLEVEHGGTCHFGGLQCYWNWIDIQESF